MGFFFPVLLKMDVAKKKIKSDIRAYGSEFNFPLPKNLHWTRLYQMAILPHSVIYSKRVSINSCHIKIEKEKKKVAAFPEL